MLRRTFGSLYQRGTRDAVCKMPYACSAAFFVQIICQWNIRWLYQFYVQLLLDSVVLWSLTHGVIQKSLHSSIFDTQKRENRLAIHSFFYSRLRGLNSPALCSSVRP